MIDPPVLNAEQEALIAVDHKMLMEVGGYDDHAVFCRTVSDDHAEVFYVPYSWRRAIKQHPELGTGSSSVHLLMRRLSDGCWLWARRAPHLDGYWSWAAAGGVDPGETHAQAVIREAEEELGISAEMIGDLQLVGRIEGIGYATIWTATLKDGATFAPNRREVSDVVWLPDPYTLDPLSQSLHLMRSDIKRLLRV